MNSGRKNPIAEQSKKWLMTALLELMETETYSDITIKEITDKASLSRRTFYRNFKTKEDILSVYFETICEEYVISLKKETDLILPNITRVFFSFCQNHLDFFQLLRRHNLFFLLLEKLNEFIPGLYNTFKGDKNEFASKDDLKYALAFSVGGYWNMLSLWLDDAIFRSPSELAVVIQDVLRASAR